MKKCAAAGCNAKVLKNTHCEHHRERVRKPDEPRKPEAIHARRERKRRRARARLAAGSIA